MYLLNYDQIKKNVLGEHLNYLNIYNFKTENLQHTSYYFRLGKSCTRFDETGEPIPTVLDKGNKQLIIKPNEYVIVESIEVFALSDKVKGTIGSLSDMIKMGLQINYSPFIDPLYHGWLSVGIKNLLNKDICLTAGDNIGKVSFYDISDTYPIKLIEGSKQESLFAERAIPDGPNYPDIEDDSELFEKKSWSKN